MKKIKVLHVLWYGQTGGVERFVRDIMVYSNKEQFEHAACFLSQGGPLADQIADSGAKTYCLGMTNGLSVMAAMRVLGVIGKFKPDIITVHDRNYVTNILFLFFPNIQIVFFEHGGVMDGNISNKEKKLYKYFFNCFARFSPLILTNTNYMKDKIVEITKINPEKIKLYNYGIDVDKYGNHFMKTKVKSNLSIPENHKVFGIVGRLAEQKGVDDFIKIASEVKKLNKQSSFIVIGDGPLRFGLEKMAAGYGVDIRFLGDRQDLPELLNVFDVYIFTSKWESFGIIMLEALATKVPVVGFEVPGNKEIIKKGGGGILIKERNCHEVAKIAVDLLEDEKRYAELSKEGYLNVQKNFSVQKTIKILEEEYSLLLDGRIRQ
jgi:glycosyltransferase involved in cell wall biosynthesis